MVKKRLGYVELEWSCPQCDGRNPGTARFCMACGKGQPEEVAFHQPAEEKLISDEAKLARAKAGPDLHCPYCVARNPGSARFCQQCGGDLSSGARRKRGAVLGAHRSEPAAPIICPACSTSNPGGSLKCANCGANLALASATKAQPSPETRSPGRGRWLLIGLAVFACLALIIFSGLGLRSTDLVGTVESLSWERSIAILGLAEVTRNNWHDQIPFEARLLDCEERVRRTADQPEERSVEVCGTAYTVDQGSGFGEVVQDCVYQVYDDWCSYAAEEQTIIDQVTVSGTNASPYWPELTLRSGQSQGEVSESYQVTFSSGNRTFSYTPADGREFVRYSPGSRWNLRVSGLGNVTVVGAR